MPAPRHALIFAAALLCPGTALATGAETAPDPEATRIIEAFGLRESDTPLSRHPRWEPRRVVISLPSTMSSSLPDFEQRLLRMAGDVEIVFDQSNNYAPDAGVLEGADAVLGVCNPATLENIDTSLLWFHSYWVGVEGCAGLADAPHGDRLLSNSKRLSGPAIAEHTIAMMMALARGLPTFARADSWDRSLARGVTFGELHGRRMLVVGLGGIGSQVARRGHGLGMKVTGIRNSSRQGPDYVEYVGLPDELLTLAASADVVVNALPLTSATTGLFNEKFFQAVKPGALFLSVGRGRSTVTADLVAALRSGRLAGAGLDVTDPEPLPADSPLWQMDNVIITPHISAAGGDSTRRIAVIAAENLRRYLAGEPLLNQVDTRAGY